MCRLCFVWIDDLLPFKLYAMDLSCYVKETFILLLIDIASLELFKANICVLTCFHTNGIWTVMWK